MSDINHPDLQIVAACRNASKLDPGYRGEVRVGDLRDMDYQDRLLVGIDIICHAAGWTSFENREADASREYLEPSIELVNRAIEWRVARFVNLSSIAVVPPEQRQDDEARSGPVRHFPMLNCLIAVEDYIRAHASHLNSFVTLRAGIYSGAGLDIGVLPLLLKRHMPSTRTSGRLGYLPLVDGRDLAQAFVRAALAPDLPQNSVMSVVGPECPTQSEVYDFLNQNYGVTPPGVPLPGELHRLRQKFSRLLPGTSPLSLFLTNPQMSSSKARSLLGYDPEISWQASLRSLLAELDGRETVPHSKPTPPLNFE